MDWWSQSSTLLPYAILLQHKLWLNVELHTASCGCLWISIQSNLMNKCFWPSGTPNSRIQPTGWKSTGPMEGSPPQRCWIVNRRIWRRIYMKQPFWLWITVRKLEILNEIKTLSECRCIKGAVYEKMDLNDWEGQLGERLVSLNFICPTEQKSCSQPIDS